MYKNYDVYKFAIKILDDSLDSVISCQKDIIRHHQDYIDAIKDDETLSELSRRKKIEEYMQSILSIHKLLKKNNIIINLINRKIDELKNNINYLTAAEEKVASHHELERATSNLRKVVIDETNEFDKLVVETNDLLSALHLDTRSYNKKVLKEECQKLSRLYNEMTGMLDGISFNVDKNDQPNELRKLINKIVDREQKRSQSISVEASHMLELNPNEIFGSDQLSNFCLFLRNEYDGLIKDTQKFKQIATKTNKQEIMKAEKVAFNLLQEVFEEETHRIINSLNKLEDLLDGTKTPTIEEQNLVFNTIDDNNDLEKIADAIDKESQRLTEYTNMLQGFLSEIKDGKGDAQEIIQRFSKSYDQEKVKHEQVKETIDQVVNNDRVAEKERDTIEYKKYNNVLNKSFWEARQKASSENIKYPSSLYEQKVREYQNEYLLNNYKISLDEVEKAIDIYKQKYAQDIYVDDLYYHALAELREETNASIQQICDETNGLSMIDQRAYKLLEKDLENIIKEISKIKTDEHFDDNLPISEYRKSLKLSKLLDQKEIIEHQMDIIKKHDQHLKQSNS